MRFVHPTYGIFVQLEAGAKAVAGEVLEVVKDGKVVASISVDRVTPAEKEYPNGCAVCKPVRGEAAVGQGVRKAKP